MNSILNLFFPEMAARRSYRASLASRLRELYATSMEERTETMVEYVQAFKRMPMSTAQDFTREFIYEFPLEFYQLFLGKTLKFSCCFFTESTYTLDQAEEAMLELYCDRSRLENRHSVLDIGGGWGALAFHIANKFPACNITSVSYSNIQKEYIDEECKKRGITNIKAINCEVSKFETEETFDRVFAVQILEHLRNYELAMKKFAGFLKPDGLFFTEFWGHKYFIYEKKGKGKVANASDDEILSTMLCEDLLLHFQDDLVISNKWCINGTHSARTSESWARNMDKNHQALLDIFTKLYGANCAQEKLAGYRNNFVAGFELFNFRNGQEWVVCHQLFKKRICSAQSVY